MSKFSKCQQKIADFIINNYDKVAFMTASRLGATIGVSESTVVRFATKIGFNGYPELQHALREVIQNKLTTVQRIEVTNDQIGNEDDLLERVLNLDIDKIRKTLDKISRSDFKYAVDLIVKSRKIYIIGTRSAASIANFMSFYFTLIFQNIQVIYTTSKSEMFEKIFNIQDGDVLIGISFPRYSSNTVQAFQYAHRNNAKTIAITDSFSSPLIKYADSVLLAQSDMISFIDGLVAPLSLVNALIIAVGLKKKAKISEIFQKLEYIWEEYRVYENFKVKRKSND
ncbi:MAG: MurR/RpiR family transcriptional regulator [Oscillospiraceae bacterium]|nr:MurR/RpiR family transcriptional regulator [Oscillospiraceae bacterium]